MRLYFLRHGLADREAWRGENDFERPLTDKGKARMAREADRMAELGVKPDHILTSPLIRARQTAEIVAKRLDMEDRLRIEDHLALGFDARKLAEVLKAHGPAESLFLVGHEPDFSQTIAEIIGGGALVCKKGSLARVDLESLHPPRGTLVWLIPPSALDS